MSTLQTACKSEGTIAHRYISLIVLAGLLFLRLPILAGGRYFYETPPEWLDPTFELTTYFLTAFLIWWERDRWAIFHIDSLAVLIIILFKPMETLILTSYGFDWLPLTFPRIPSLLVWAIAVMLAVALKLSRVKLKRIEKAKLRWFAVGILVGIGLAILTAYPMSFQVNQSELKGREEFLPFLLGILLNFFNQLGYAAIAEEPLFRGFLWGHLREAGWKDVSIWLFQAGLFALSHIYYVSNSPVSFWLFVPLVGLVFGFMAWRSHSIATSMAVHATVNSLANILARLVAYYRL